MLKKLGSTPRERIEVLDLWFRGLEQFMDRKSGCSSTVFDEAILEFMTAALRMVETFPQSSRVANAWSNCAYFADSPRARAGLVEEERRETIFAALRLLRSELKLAVLGVRG